MNKLFFAILLVSIFSISCIQAESFDFNSNQDNLDQSNFDFDYPSSTTSSDSINASNVSHNELAGLQGGTTDEYYHIQQSWYNELSSNIFNWITDLTSFTSDDLAEGTTNKYWNETATDDLYVNTDGDTMTGNLTNSEWFNGKFNWTTDDWASFDGSLWEFNESKLSTIYYNATSYELVSGTNGGDLSLTQHKDGNYDGVTLNFTEQVSAPALDVRFNFTDGITDFTQGIMRYYTSSLAGDAPIIQLWDYEDGEWEDYPRLIESPTFVVVEQPVFDASSHVQNGTVQMRLYKSGNGNTNNEYYMDWLAIAKGFGVPAGEEVDPYGIHKDGTSTVTANIDFNGYNVSSDNGGWFKGLFNWTAISNYLNFNGATLTLNDTKLEEDFNQTQMILDNNASWTSTYNETYANYGNIINASWNESYANDLYVNVDGDTMTGDLNLTQQLFVENQTTFYDTATLVPPIPELVYREKATSNYAGGIVKKGDMLIIAENRLRFFNAVNPGSLEQICEVNPGWTNPAGCDLSGNYLICGARDRHTVSQYGFNILDISDPCSSTRIGVLDMFQVDNQDSSIVKIYGHYAFWGGESDPLGDFKVIDWQDPYNPVIIWSANLSSTGQRVWNMDIDSINKILYVTLSGGVADYDSYEFLAFDISNPESPVYLGGLDLTAPGVQYRAVKTYGATTFVSQNNANVKIVNTTNPASMNVLATIDDFASEIFRAGKYLYLFNNFYGYSAYDLTTISSPVQIMDSGNIEYSGGGGNSLAAFDGRYFYYTFFVPAGNPIASGVYTEVDDVGAYVSHAIQTGSIETTQLNVAGNTLLNNLESYGRTNFGGETIFSGNVFGTKSFLWNNTLEANEFCTTDGICLGSITSGNSSWNESYARELFYTKDEVDTNFSNYYTKLEVDTNLSNYILTSSEGDLNVNSSEYWDDLNTFNSTQMENSEGELNILESWLRSLFDALFGAKDTDDLSEGSTNFYDNRSWNESYADTLYSPISLVGSQWLNNSNTIYTLDKNVGIGLSDTNGYNFNLNGTLYVESFSVTDGSGTQTGASIELTNATASLGGSIYITAGNTSVTAERGGGSIYLKAGNGVEESAGSLYLESGFSDDELGKIYLKSQGLSMWNGVGYDAGYTGTCADGTDIVIVKGVIVNCL